MRLLPFENITYRTQIDAEEIPKRIGEILEPRKTFRITGMFGSVKHQPYEGSVDAKSFDINRIPGYRNSFLPRIKGTIEADHLGTKIDVKMRLRTYVLAFVVLWFGVVGVFGATTMAEMLNSQAFEAVHLIPFGMLVFAYAVVLGGFKYESNKSRKYLAVLLEAEIVP